MDTFCGFSRRIMITVNWLTVELFRTIHLMKMERFISMKKKYLWQVNVGEYDFLFSLGRFTTRRRGGGQKHSQHRHRPLRVLHVGRVGHLGRPCY